MNHPVGLLCRMGEKLNRSRKLMRIGLKRSHTRKKSQIPPAPWQEFIEI